MHIPITMVFSWEMRQMASPRESLAQERDFWSTFLGKAAVTQVSNRKGGMQMFLIPHIYKDDQLLFSNYCFIIITQIFFR